MSAGKDMLRERLKLSNELWQRGVAAEYSHQRSNPILPEQMSYAAGNRIPLGVIIAPGELSKVALGSLVQVLIRCTAHQGVKVANLSPCSPQPRGNCLILNGACFRKIGQI